MKRIFFASTIALTSIFSGTVNAAIIEADYLTSGDNGAFIDTETGLTFLDFDYTRGQSINETKLRIQDGGDLAGWRLATQDDVESLFFSLTNRSTDGAKTTLRYSSGGTLQNVSGTPFSDPYGSASYGLFKGDDNSVYLMGFTTYKATTYNNYLRSASLDYSADIDAVYLVKGTGSNLVSDVPAPFMAFAGLGLLALGMRRKKH